MSASNLYSAIQDHLPGVFFKGYYEGKYVLTEISAGCVDLIGYKAEELTAAGISLPDFVHPEDRDILQQKHAEQYRNGEAFVTDFRIVTRNGAIKWVKEITTYKQSEDGSRMLIEGMVTDITPFKTGVSVSSAFNSYQSAVNSASIVSISDLQGKIIFANDHFITVSQYSLQELIGADHSIVNSGYHPPAFFADLWKTILSGKIWRGQIRNKAKDGSLYWVDSIIAPVLDEQSRIQQFLSIRNVITEQKEIEYNLRESEALNRSVLSSLNASIAILDERGLIEKVDQNWAQNLSQSDKALLNAPAGSNYFELLKAAEAGGDKCAPMVRKGIQDVLNGGQEVFEYEYPCSDQTGQKWVLLHISKFENDVRRLVISHFDITERKRQEDEIRRSETRMLEAQRIAHIGSWELDLRTNTLVGSEESYRIFELDPNGPETFYNNFLDMVHPEDREEVNQAFMNSVQNHSVYDIVHRLLFKDGRVKYIREQCETFYDTDGSPLRSVGTCQDITREKESEILLENRRIQYESVVENISDGLFIDDIDGKVAFANTRFLDMIGISRDDLKSFVFDDYVAPEYKDIIRQRHKQRMQGEEVSSIFEYVALRKDGSRRWFEARVTKIMRGSKIIGTQSAIRDVTEAKESIDRLKASEAEKTNLLHELNQRYNELMQFNYIVSHNLRAPIANIIGLADMFNMDDIDEAEKKQVIAHIQFSINKIDELINDLNIILAARSDINSKKEKVDFAEIILRVENTLQKQIKEAHARIEVQIAPDAAEIFSIKSYIKSILYNLVNNAIKYRSAGKDPLIEIGISKANEQIEIRVQDNGIGIDLVKYGHDIFGLYKRFHPSFEGKGLGLNMTKVQVELLGGSIQIASQPGEGTLFTIRLPESGPKALNND